MHFLKKNRLSSGVLPAMLPVFKKSSLVRNSIIPGIVVLVIAAYIVWKIGRPSSIHFLTQPIVRQSLIQSASATGTVNPQNTILVGSQVSGIISALFADYNSPVRSGEILARVDPTPFQAALKQAQANLAQANAQTDVARQAAVAAQSTVTVNQANAISATAQSAAAWETSRIASEAVTSAQTTTRAAESASALGSRTLSRDRKLLRQGYIAQSQFDADQSALVAEKSTFDNAQTNVRQTRLQSLAAQSQAHSSEALQSAALRQIAQTQALALGAFASIEASQRAAKAMQALLQEAQLNLDHTVITSPVSGTVIARNVSIGQTIAASLAAPTLFTIAQDLNKMEIDIAVGEPDIGSVVDNAPLEFSVLAYPNRLFQSRVTQVRENPTTIANVVTYDVVTLIDNRDRSLRPGMTATAAIRIAEVNNSLVVPLAALQWQPAATQVQKTAITPPPSANTSSGNSPWGQTSLGATGAVIAGSTAVIYIDKSEKPMRMLVHVLLVSGAQAAVTPVHGTIAVGELAIIGTSNTTTSNNRPQITNAAGSNHGGLHL